MSRSARFVVAVAVTACLLAGAAHAVPTVVDFESLPAGTTVEGPGAVHPDLVITSRAWAFGTGCPLGSAAIIEEGNTVPYDAYGTSSGVENGCLNGVHGFADDHDCVLDYDFTFVGGLTVSCFSLRMFDYGDYFPYGGTTHHVTLTAYDASNAVLATSMVSVAGGTDSLSGDACLSQAGAPGNYNFQVLSPGIARVSLTFDAYPDPNVGFDDLKFCAEERPTPADRRSWGVVKSLYR